MLGKYEALRTVNPPDEAYATINNSELTAKLSRPNSAMDGMGNGSGCTVCQRHARTDARTAALVGLIYADALARVD